MISNKSLFISSLILALGLIGAGFFIGQTLVAGKKLDRTVVVKGLAEKEVEANLAVWPMQITLSSNNLNELQGQLERQTGDLVAFFSKNGFDESELTIGAPNIQDAQAQLYGNQSGGPYRYIAQTDITIRTSDLPKLQRANQKLPSLIGQGIVIGSKNQWQPIDYSFTRLNDIKPGMIEEATKKAREAAEKFARDSGSKVGKIKSAHQGIFTISNLDANTGHIKNVRIVSTIEFYLED